MVHMALKQQLLTQNIYKKNYLLKHASFYLFVYREKEKMKGREDAWTKVNNLAIGNPQVCH
jgi:hypothetical protein